MPLEPEFAPVEVEFGETAQPEAQGLPSMGGGHYGPEAEALQPVVGLPVSEDG